MRTVSRSDACIIIAAVAISASPAYAQLGRYYGGVAHARRGCNCLMCRQIRANPVSGRSNRTYPTCRGYSQPVAYNQATYRPQTSYVQPAVSRQPTQQVTYQTVTRYRDVCQKVCSGGRCFYRTVRQPYTVQVPVYRQSTPAPVAVSAVSIPAPRERVVESSKKLTSKDMPPEAQPTPMEEVTRILGIINPLPSDHFGDPGCGYDARWVITAARQYRCRCLGIEMDRKRYESACEYVRQAERDYPHIRGLIEIVHGDATEVDWGDVNVAVVYLYPRVLQQLRPKLERLDRFASYMHPVDGMSMVSDEGAFVWRRPERPDTMLATTERRTTIPIRSYGAAL